jgi:hypothetical protein
MTSFAERLPERIRRPIFDTNEWPHDPLNMAIMLACFYVVPPFIGAVWISLLLTGWDQKIPLWLDPLLVALSFVIGWIALDEWRSRRRSNGEAHGWIWQMVERYRPRRAFNRLMLALTLVVLTATRVVAYIDRVIGADLDRSHALFIAETAVLAPILIWIAAAAVGWRHALHSKEASLIYRSWLTLVMCFGTTSLFLGLASVTDETEIVSRVLGGVGFLTFFPGWAVQSLVDRLRGQHDAIDTGWPKIARPGWW